jgi:HAD superfamily hydrolase (TIGR01549 family)
MNAILFDWDGTLADTLGAIYAANVQVMAVFGLPFDPVRYRRHFAPDWRVMYANLGVPDDRLDEANARWWAALDEGETTLFPGVRDGLVRLVAAGHPLGIVTAGRSDRIGAELHRHGLDGFFGAVVFGDDMPAQKPDPAPLKAGLARLGYATRAAEAVYVGDTPDDMRMAKATGVQAVGVESILGGALDLEAAGAVETFASAAEWIDRLLAGLLPGAEPAPG